MARALALTARGLSRSFGPRLAVDRVSLQVARGETLALLGPNGAGKTTTVHMLTTILRPTSGSARVAGVDVGERPDEVRRRIGVVFQGPSSELQLSARQNLRLHAELYRVPRDRVTQRVDAMLQEANLADRADEELWRFSGGMRRRLEIVRAVLHEPEVLFLDEPTTGLDPQARLYTWDLLERLQRERRMAVLLTTHDMHEADRLARRVAIMDQGRLLAVDTPAALKDALGKELVVLRVGRGITRLRAPLAAVAGVGGVEWKGKEAWLHVDRADRALPAVLAAAHRSGAEIDGMDVRRPTLEDVFIARTGRGLREQP